MKGEIDSKINRLAVFVLVLVARNAIALQMKDSDHPQGDGSQSGHDTLTMKMMEHHSSGARSELDALPRDQVVRALDKLSGGSIPSLINRYSGADVVKALDNLKSNSNSGFDSAGRVNSKLTASKADSTNVHRQKRNFDEIDRSGFNSLVGKRDFDEIDRSGFRGFYKRNFDEIDRSGFRGFAKRNFDEIDRSGFAGFNGKRNFDEIDRSGFRGFAKKNFDEIDNAGFAGFAGKRNFDEINRSSFGGFNKRASQPRDAPSQSTSNKGT